MQKEKQAQDDLLDQLRSKRERYERQQTTVADLKESVRKLEKELQSAKQMVQPEEKEMDRLERESQDLEKKISLVCEKVRSWEKILADGVRQVGPRIR